MTYINGKYLGGDTETVDQFETYKEAMLMIKEYNLCYLGYDLWLSNRSTKEWRGTQ